MYHLESWSRECALWFKLIGPGEEIPEYVGRVAPRPRTGEQQRRKDPPRLDKDY
jgi:hypothetical protein